MPKPEPLPVSVEYLEIPLFEISQGLYLRIDSRIPGTLFKITDHDQAHYEAPYQLKEGFYYDYTLNDPHFYLSEVGAKSRNIVQPRVNRPEMGTLAPNIHVGTLQLKVVRKGDSKENAPTVRLEIQSLKTSYRDEYRDMLEYITEQCTGLLIHSDQPSLQTLEVDYRADYQTLYQRFAFIRSVITSDEFSTAVNRIVTNPVTTWKNITEQQDIRRVRRFSGAGIRMITRGENRQTLPKEHPLYKQGIYNLPARVQNIRKTDTVDTPENRFVKHALETFLWFCTDIKERVTSEPKSELYLEAEGLSDRLEQYLQHAIFSDISRPETLRLNSPVLQRKSGYREILRAWLMFDLAARLIWSGGDDVYEAGKKDVATLYEYWLFFQLLELFRSQFLIEPKDINSLIESRSDGLNLTLKQGKETALRGVYRHPLRDLNIRFSYNRRFSGSSSEINFPDTGSWTSAMRPDYTLSIWPDGMKESIAENEELIVHIHFDAKYKVENLADYLNWNGTADDQALSDEKRENREGKWKNADLLKMHAYKDAIRRTGGAYVLYPGNEAIKRHGFREIIPGLGAFPVSPSRDDTGIGELRKFIAEVVTHFINRTSQREKMAQRAFSIYGKEINDSNQNTIRLPEATGADRDHLPDETYVLVGYVRSEAHYIWIKETNKYNFRPNVPLTSELTGARYLLLYNNRNLPSADLWRIGGEGPKITSISELIDDGYPASANPQDFYLVVDDLKPVTDPILLNVQWDIPKLCEGREKFKPFVVSLAKLIKKL